jgi:hypothetical protein
MHGGHPDRCWPSSPWALGTGVAYVLTVLAAGRVGATKASAFLILPVALLLGVLVPGETVAKLSVVGGVVCLAGARLMRRAQLEHAVRGPALRTAEYTQVGERAG